MGGCTYLIEAQRGHRANWSAIQQAWNGIDRFGGQRDFAEHAIRPPQPAGKPIALRLIEDAELQFEAIPLAAEHDRNARRDVVVAVECANPNEPSCSR